MLIELIIIVWLYGAPFLAAAIFWFTQSRPIRWIMAPHALVPPFAYAAFLWTARYFKSIGCEGNTLKGIDCPEWTVIGRFAVWHDFLMFSSAAYTLFVFPLILLLIPVVSHLTPSRWQR